MCLLLLSITNRSAGACKRKGGDEIVAMMLARLTQMTTRDAMPAIWCFWLSRANILVLFHTRFGRTPYNLGSLSLVHLGSCMMLRYERLYMRRLYLYTPYSWYVTMWAFCIHMLALMPAFRSGAIFTWPSVCINPLLRRSSVDDFTCSGFRVQTSNHARVHI